MRSRKILGAAVALLVVTGALSGPARAVQGDPPSNDPILALEFASSWLARQFDPAGFIPDAVPSVSYSNTAQAVFALGQANAEEDTARDGIAWLEANVAANVPVDGSADPGLIGYLLLAAAGTGEDPTSFGGVDLIATLDGTLTPSGLYGTAGATYDGVFRQSVAIAGLAENGAAQDLDALEWLVGQQCGDEVEGAAGGWQPYRADTSVPCVAPDPGTFAGPDTNATAAAIWALATADFDAKSVDDGLEFLNDVQNESGGFAFVANTDADSGVDPNSTAIVIRAIRAAGEDPLDSPWIQSQGDPYTALLSFQVQCGPTQVGIGAFEASYAPGANLFATTGALWGAAFSDLDDHFYVRHAFTDVCASNPFQFDIAVVADQGIIKGLPDGTFQPLTTTTRQVFAAYVYRMDGEPAYVPPTTPTFSDVPTTNPFYAEIEWANAEGIIEGFSDGTFGPSNALTRQAGAVLLYRFFDIFGFTPPATPTFSDVPSSSQFYTEIEWAFDAGLVNGFPNGTFGPTNPMSRQASAAFIARSF